MNELNIFSYTSYKGYLNEKIAAMPKKGRGFKAQLAERIGCQKAFVSQVLQGEAHFNLEHGEKINLVLQHDRDEAYYFLLLIQQARAGIESLRLRFEEQMQALREKRLVLKNRLANERDLSAADKSKYYSSWIYGAIRIATTVPLLQTKEALLRRLSLPEDRLNEALAFLETAGLIERKGERYLPTTFHLHLGNDQDLILRHHTNWRLRTLDAIAEPGRNDLHYSAAMSLSAADATKLRGMIVEFLEQSQSVIKKSPEEALYCLCTDFFEL